MVSCADEAGCDIFGKAAGDIESLRQQVIVHLLRRIPMGPDKFCTAVRQLMQCGVLTKDVMLELSVSGLCTDPIHEIPPSLQPVAGALVSMPAWPRLAGPAPLGPSSRFQQEFERVELLGRGAFGEVWRCRHRLDGREYAVKSVHYHASEADSIEQRVLREAQTWASMDHPHIARYHSAWVEATPVLGAAHAPGGVAGLALRAPEQPAEAVQAETATSITFTADQSDGGVTFREASGCSSVSAQPAVPASLPAIAEQDAGRPAKAEPMVTGIVARRSNARRGLSTGAGSPGRSDSYHAVLYIQTELCRKDTLGSWIAKRNASWAAGRPGDRRRWALEACQIFRECISAVAHLHARRCMHRDLKPSNILFASDGAIRLGDFGLAKVVDSPMALEDAQGGLPTSMAFPQETRGVGTPAYASPEQLAGGSCSVKADVYALGVILVELLTPVDTQMERAALLQGLRLGDWKPPGAFPRTARLVEAMTRAEPAKRMAADEVLEAFSEVVREVQQHFGGGHALTSAAADGSPQLGSG